MLSDGFKAIFIIVVGFVVLSAASFGVYKYLSPAEEQVRYDTFKNSQAYRDGTIQDLETLRVQYQDASTQGAKDAIRDTVRRRTAAVDRNLLTPELRQFISDLNL